MWGRSSGRLSGDQVSPSDLGESDMKRSILRRARTLRGPFLAVAAAVVLSGCKDAKVAATAVPPPVTVARPVSESVANYLDFTGTTAATQAVTVVARVEGYLEQIHFTDGQQVKKGDLLFTIQQTQYEAQLKQAQAEVEVQKAALQHAEIELPRYARLVKQDAATQTEVDHWQTEKEQAAARLLAARAQVELAQLKLSYTLVRAPIDGRIGRHLIDKGSLVGGLGQPTSLAEIDHIDPIYVYFTIDQRELLRVMERNKALPRDTITQGAIPATFGLLTEDGYPHTGRLDFASISVAPTTGTLQVRGVFPNNDFAVLPGLFARVRISALEKTSALLIPGDAVRFDQQGEYVLVVNAKNIVERRGVKVGLQVGSRLVISEGLNADDSVVVEGLLQAVPGREVSPHAAASAGHPAPGN
jgi:multidrug efflux system membrane fusion protein